MRLFSWNVNGIRAVVRKGEFEAFMSRFDPDVLCLQETKANREQVNLETPGYRQYWNSAERKGYSGTAIFSRHEPLVVTNGLPDDIVDRYALAGDEYGSPAGEGRLITAEFNDFSLVTVYTPNAKDDLSRLDLRYRHWDPAFHEYCNRLKERKPVVFCGDLNVAHTPDDLARPKQNEGEKGFTAEEREGFQNFIENGFIDTFRLDHHGNGYYTWWSFMGGGRVNNVGWRIDYFLTSADLRDRIVAAEIHPEQMGSDHCPISLELDAS